MDIRIVEIRLNCNKSLDKLMRGDGAPLVSSTKLENDSTLDDEAVFAHKRDDERPRKQQKDLCLFLCLTEKVPQLLRPQSGILSYVAL